MSGISYLWVGLGGATGAILRVGLSAWLPHLILSMPFKIFFINVLGCFVLGLLTETITFYWDAPLSMRHFLIQGVLGGFTTFSAFSMEFGLLYKDGSPITAFVYAVLTVALSLSAFFGGLKIIRSLTILFPS